MGATKEGAYNRNLDLLVRSCHPLPPAKLESTSNYITFNIQLKVLFSNFFMFLDFTRLLDEWEVDQWNWMGTFEVDRLIYKVLY